MVHLFSGKGVADDPLKAVKGEILEIDLIAGMDLKNVEVSYQSGHWRTALPYLYPSSASRSSRSTKCPQASEISRKFVGAGRVEPA